jgi:hypothetical protein
MGFLKVMQKETRITEGTVYIDKIQTNQIAFLNLLKGKETGQLSVAQRIPGKSVICWHVMGNGTMNHIK